MLTDPQVAALARQAVDLLGPEIDIRIDAGAGADPYRYGGSRSLVWPLIDGPANPPFGIWVSSTMSAAEALAHLIDGLGNDVSDTRRFWGVAFPPCPRHPHPAAVEVAGEHVEFRCPQTGSVVAAIKPAA